MRPGRISLTILCALALLGRSASSQPSPAAAGTATPDGARAEFSGMLLPCRTALIKSKFDDRVSDIPLGLGARVKAGQLLLRFMDDAYRVARERSAVLLARAQSEFDRARRLHDQNELSAEEFERAQTAVQLAKADDDLAIIQLRERSIVAPFDGILAERFVDSGASVSQGDPLLRVTATTPLRVQVLLPERLLPMFKALPTLKVSLSSPETTLWLPVRQRPILVDPASGMFPLQIEVDNARGRLTPGVTCRIGIVPRVPTKR
jgi:RND family efflux transporter MFP subunit